jgi:hypothetical protein
MHIEPDATWGHAATILDANVRRADVGVALVAALVCAASVVCRIVVASIDAPPWLVIFGQSDVYQTWRDAHLEGHRLPYFDTGFSYPPVIGYVAGLMSLIVSSPRGYMIGWGVVIVAVGGVLGYVLSRAAGPRRALVYFAAAPQLLLYAGVNFDVIPAALAAVAALYAGRDRATTSAAWAAAGAAAKFFAAVFAPLIVLRAARASRSRAIAAAALFVIVLGGIYLPAAVAPYSQLAYTAEYAYGLGPNVDSVWRLPFVVLQALGTDANLVILVVTTAGLAVTYLALVLPRGLRASDPAVGFGLALVALLFWNRYYSPQYAIWLLPFFSLLPVRPRLFGLFVLADLGIFFTIYPMTLVLHRGDALLDVLVFPLVAAMVLRHAALVLLWRDLSRIAATRG